MTSNIVLKKIMTLLSLQEKGEIALTYARLKDGTIVESPTFDVEEPLDVVSEDGTKTPAPDGWHELALKDTEGNETYIKVYAEGGVIKERENVELEMVDVKDIPQDGPSKANRPVNEVPTLEGSVTSGSTKLAETELPSGDGVEESVEPLTEDTDKAEPEEKTEEMKAYEKLSYRIEELEKKLQAMEEVKEESDIEPKEVDEEDELPKLDGAPTEKIAGNTKLSSVKTKQKSANTQNRFLEKLYK
jgi:hypothetical protein